MHYIPVDVMNTKPSSGFLEYPDGVYLVQLTNCHEQPITTKDGKSQRQPYQGLIVMGPGPSQEQAGKPYTYFLSMDPKWAGRHMELFVAALGSEEGVRQVAAQHQGQLPGETLENRYVILELATGKSGYQNVRRALPYTPEGWTAVLSETGADAAPAAAAAPAPMGGMMNPNVPGPVAAPPPPAPSFQPPPAPTYQPPMAAPNLPPVPTVPGVPTAAPATAGLPTPPPPPGLPAVR